MENMSSHVKPDLTTRKIWRLRKERIVALDRKQEL
jgi:hypothetical protein